MLVDWYFPLHRLTCRVSHYSWMVVSHCSTPSQIVQSNWKRFQYISDLVVKRGVCVSFFSCFLPLFFFFFLLCFFLPAGRGFIIYIYGENKTRRVHFCFRDFSRVMHDPAGGAPVGSGGFLSRGSSRVGSGRVRVCEHWKPYGPGRRSGRPNTTQHPLEVS